MPATEYEIRREVFEVTEYRDDSVFKTQSHGYYWLRQNDAQMHAAELTGIPVTKIILAAPSTKTFDPSEMHIRRKQ